VAIGEMLRVLKSSGTIAFSTWPPEHFAGRMFCADDGLPAAAERRSGASGAVGRSAILSGSGLGSDVKDIHFDRATMFIPALSPSHHRISVKKAQGLWCGSWQRCRVTTPPSWNAFAGSTMRW